MAYVCQMCGKYAKTKSEIIKHYKKEHKLFFFILNRRSLDFKPLLEKANPTLIDSLLDNPNPLVRNVSAQPLNWSHLQVVEWHRKAKEFVLLKVE